MTIEREATTLIAVPTYNERNNVKEIHRRIRTLSSSVKIIFLDDNSPDGTGDLLDEIAQNDANTLVAHRGSKLGIGSAHQDAITMAYDLGYEVLITLDADLTHQPEDIPSLINGLKNHDLVIASRFSGGITDWPLLRRLMTRFGHLLTVILLRTKHDATSAFRGYDLVNIHRDIFSEIESNSYSFFFESLNVIESRGYKVTSVPTILTARFSGDSKMRLSDVVGGLAMLAKISVRSKRRKGSDRKRTTA